MTSSEVGNPHPLNAKDACGSYEEPVSAISGCRFKRGRKIVSGSDISKQQCHPEQCGSLFQSCNLQLRNGIDEIGQHKHA